MKACLQCGQENENGARFCQRCGHFGFAPAVTPATPPEPADPKAKSGPEFLTAEREGKLTVLKCRTPGEAYLVARELEAVDILVMLPDNEVLLKEFRSNGFVSIRVSAQSYEAAKELQTVIERKHWEERAQQPLSIPMIIAAVGLGLMPFPGFLILPLLNDAHKRKGYQRKAKLFTQWFCVGLALFFALILILSNLHR